MITIEEMQDMLDEIAGEFPPVFFDNLNGGILLLGEARYHDEDTDGDLYTLGLYNAGGGLGRYISIYYGSFMRVFGHLSREEIKTELRKTVRHEFRHHLESMAGDDDLERLDAEDIEDYHRGDSDDDFYTDPEELAEDDQ